MTTKLINKLVNSGIKTRDMQKKRATVAESTLSKRDIGDTRKVVLQITLQTFLRGGKSS